MYPLFLTLNLFFASPGLLMQPMPVWELGGGTDANGLLVSTTMNQLETDSGNAIEVDH